MGFLYVQIYTVSKGKVEEHDEQMKKNKQDVKSVTGMTGRLFQQRHGPIGGRVLIQEFKDYDEFQSFWDKFDNDEKTLKVRSKFQELIDPASWRAVFWDETAIE
jgi:hypothetical protein